MSSSEHPSVEATAIDSKSRVEITPGIPEENADSVPQPERGAEEEDAKQTGQEHVTDASGPTANPTTEADTPDQPTDNPSATTELGNPESLRSQSFTATNTSLNGSEKEEDEGVSKQPKWRLLNMINPFGNDGGSSIVGGPDRGPNPSAVASSSTAVCEPKLEDKTTIANKSTRFTYGDFIEKMRKPQSRNQAKKLNGFLKKCLNEPRIGPAEIKRIHQFTSEMHAEICKSQLWREAGELELDNVFESLEKCLLRRVYKKVMFGSKEDQAANVRLQRTIFCHQFLQPENLDIKEIYYDEAVWQLAQVELQKINMYKPPRDKIVCLLNCCKMILNLLKTVKEREIGAGNMDPEKLKRKSGLLPSADDFLPLLLFMVLKAQVPNLYLNIRYIEMARHPRKLSGEAAYYFTNLKSAVAFIERISAEVLSIDPEVYTKSLKAAEKKWKEENAKFTTVAASKLEQNGSHVDGKGVQAPLKADKPLDSPAVVEQSGKSKISGLSRYRFYHMKPEDLKIGDVPQLLEEYKRMASLLNKLSNLPALTERKAPTQGSPWATLFQGGMGV